MRKKGFTLVELLIVIAIIALLMGILMPALARVRMYAYRMTCGTNLAGIGKAVLLYSNDAKGEDYPMPGLGKYAALNNNQYFETWHGMSGGGPLSVTDVYTDLGGLPNIIGTVDHGVGTIGSLFYLLVKYQDVSVKQFNCKGDVGVKTFKLTDFSVPGTQTIDFTRAWDFGRHPSNYNSYSYHNPFSRRGSSPHVSYPVNNTSPPAAVLAADRAPTLDRNVTYIASGSPTLGGTTSVAGAKLPGDPAVWTTSNNNEYRDPDLLYNAFPHQREGQNVLFNDGHVNFERQANVGVDNDNIWQRWPTNPLSTSTWTAKREREAGGYFPPGGSTCINPSSNEYWYPLTMGDTLLVTEQQVCPTN